MTQWQTFLIALLAAIPPTLAGILAFVQGVRNSAKVDAVHKVVNGNLEQAKKDSFVEGYKSAKNGDTQP